MNDVKRRLEKLKTIIDAEMQKSAFVELTYQDGTKERRKFLPLLFDTYAAYVNDTPLPEVAKIDFLFDTKAQGKLPDLLQYMLTPSA